MSRSSTDLFIFQAMITGVVGCWGLASFALHHLAISCTNDGGHNVSGRQFLGHACMRHVHSDTN